MLALFLYSILHYPTNSLFLKGELKKIFLNGNKKAQHMKKSLLQALIFFIILTFGLGLAQKFYSQQPTPTQEKNKEQITDKKEVSLSKWMEIYNQGKYQKIEIHDGINMKGFIFL